MAEIFCDPLSKPFFVTLPTLCNFEKNLEYDNKFRLLFGSTLHITYFTGFFNGMKHYWTQERCHDGHCGIDFHDHTQHREEVVRNASGEYSPTLLTKRAVDIVMNHDPKKVNCRVVL